MGAYLSVPETKKDSIDNEIGQLSFGASSMQGWRLEQEDAHNAILDFDPETNTSFFAVYDGHGGAEVAQYCAKYLPDYLKTLEEYKSGKLENALRELFLKFDESLLCENAEKELKELRDKVEKEMEEEDDEELDDDEEDDQESHEEEDKDNKKKEYTSETDALYDEACMPLEEVLKRYSNTEKKVKKALKKNDNKNDVSLKAKQTEENLAPPQTTTDFQKQEELDIKEIKKNGKNMNDTNENSNHEIDEASNLCDLTDSQKSDTANISVNSNKTDLKSLDELTVLNNKTSKPKLNKEELKLSPIHKKSQSSLSLNDENSSDEANTTITNGNSNEKKEEKNETNNKKSNLTRSHLIAKLLAGCINKKLKQDKNGKKAKKKVEDTKEEEEEDGDDFTAAKEENGNEDDEEDEDEDEDYEDEDTDEDEDSGEDYEDEDDDEEEEEDDDDDEEDEEENDDEYDYSTAKTDCKPGFDSGCTAVVAVLRDNKYLYVANAGDSRCVVCREGKAIEMSFDHKPEDDIERQRVEKAGGHVTRDGRINNGLNLSRAIGDHSYKANKDLPLSEQMITALPDIQKLEIDQTKDSFMVLACDGIWNFMSSQDVCDFVQERLNANYLKLSQICEELFMHCLAPNSEGDGTGCDNMTCIIITFKPFRKVELKSNNKILPHLELNSSDIEKNKLKRSLENGSNEDENSLSNNVNDQLAKKLKQDESKQELV